MLLADIPAWFAKRFGADATGTHIRAIPSTSADPNAAAMDVGFPPNTFVDISAGGAPPDGRDVNGILNFLSAWTQWFGAGGPVRYNATISSNGGYPIGSIVQSAATAGLLWQSTVDGNTTNPDAGGAGWVAVIGRRAVSADVQAGTSELLAVTPKSLIDAGVDRVVSQNLSANNGFRIFASGFKECWGSITIPADSSGTWALPTPHTSWVHPTLAVSQGVEINASQTTGILSLSTTAITVHTARNSATQVWISTRGV